MTRNPGARGLNCLALDSGEITAKGEPFCADFLNNKDLSQFRDPYDSGSWASNLEQEALPQTSFCAGVGVRFYPAW